MILGALLALTVALTQLIENAAVAIILAPIAYQVAREGHVDLKPFMVGLAICISTSFCTPIAHETTMLVMGPGPVPFQALPLHRLRNGRDRLAAHDVTNPLNLEV